MPVVKHVRTCAALFTAGGSLGYTAAMISRSGSTAAIVPLLVATLVALTLLATLQYHWVGQVSAGERERRQASLALSARRMGEDFDRELARAYLGLQMDAATLRDADWERFAARYDHWRATAPYPGLVHNVYLVEVNQGGQVGLLRYDETVRGFTPSSWPFELMPVRRRIERTYRAIFVEEDRTRIDISPVDRAGPALLIPVARPWLLSDEEELGFNADLLFSDLVFPGAFANCVRCPPELYASPLLAHTVVALDRNYIAETFLPALAERYFPAEGGLDYNMGVVDQIVPNELIFSSDAGLDARSFGTGDAAVGIFNITYDDLNRLLLASELAGGSGQESSGERIAIGVFGSAGDDAELAERGQWRLVLKHREGSLEAAVAGLRTRNLLISFGILLLLGGSMGMLLLATRRSQRLARQQLAFASAVSHELRTPLAVICSAGENLADGLVHDPQKARQYGAVIYHEGRRLTEMVEQVLAFAGAQSGQQAYHLERTDVAPLIESAVQGVAMQLREGGHALSLAVDPALPPVRADEAALRRALQNLLGNALKYGGPGSPIVVEAVVVAGEGGPELQISVSDSGPGVEPGDLPNIFEPFYRGRAATANQVAGSGLGLSLVRHTAEGHGGRVSVQSRPGHGARFTLHLPLNEGGQGLAEADDPGGQQLGAPATEGL